MPRSTRIALLVALALVVSVPCRALEPAPAANADRAGTEIAVVDILGSYADNYVSRLTGLGYSVTAIPRDSGLDVLSSYALVILPESHGNSVNYDMTNSLAADYLSYVEGGGGLWVSQPNPFGHIGHTATITWVPYLLTLYYYYDLNDCPPVIVDAEHCIAVDLPAAQFSYPGDTATEFGPEWHVVVEGAVTGNPSVFTAEHGSGRILVELGHPGNSYCPVPDEVLQRYVECTLSPTSGVERSSWSAVKARYE